MSFISGSTPPPNNGTTGTFSGKDHRFNTLKSKPQRVFTLLGGNYITTLFEGVVTGISFLKGVSLLGAKVVSINPYVLGGAGLLFTIPVVLNGRAIHEHRHYLKDINSKLRHSSSNDNTQVYKSFESTFDYILYGDVKELKRRLLKVVDGKSADDVTSALMGYQKAFMYYKMNLQSKFYNDSKDDRKIFNEIFSLAKKIEIKLSVSQSTEMSFKEILNTPKIVRELEKIEKKYSIQEGIQKKIIKYIIAKRSDLKKNIAHILKSSNHSNGTLKKVMTIFRTHKKLVDRTIKRNFHLKADSFKDSVFLIWRDNMKKLKEGNSLVKKKISTFMSALQGRIKLKIVSKSLSIVSSIITMIGIALLIFAGLATTGLVCLGIGGVLAIGLFIFDKVMGIKFVRKYEALEPDELFIR